MRSVLAILAIVAVAHAIMAPYNQITDDEMGSLYSAWKAYYAKSYTSELDTTKFENFKKNYYICVANNNIKGITYTLGLTQFADLTNDEYRSLFTMKRSKSQTTLSQNVRKESEISIKTLPNSIDWRTKTPNVLTSVKNQGQCGSCWSFSATETLESREALLPGGTLKVLSEQALVDCEHLGTPADDGCNGGEMTNAFTWYALNGAFLEKDYPTTNSDGTCHASKVTKAFNNIAGYTKIAANNAGLSAALINGPVSIGVDAGGMAWQLQFGGIIGKDGLFGCSESPLDHGVVAVGYDNEKWIVRNSWGSGWGNSGYVYLLRDGDANTCGLFSDANVPRFK